jgi:hypothetical protein
MGEVKNNPYKDPFLPLNVLSWMADSVMGKEPPHRRDVLKEELGDGCIIDTCAPPDTGRWETGIKKKDASWVIVEQYKSRGEAVEGHTKWTKLMTDEPDAKLVDIFVKEIEMEYNDGLDNNEGW